MNATGAADKSLELPGAGDVAVCLRCGAAMRYNADLSVRGMTPEEVDEITNDPHFLQELTKVVLGVHIVRALRN
jgi:hypothetical protein